MMPGLLRTKLYWATPEILLLHKARNRLSGLIESDSIHRNNSSSSWNLDVALEPDITSEEVATSPDWHLDATFFGMGDWQKRSSIPDITSMQLCLDPDPGMHSLDQVMKVIRSQVDSADHGCNSKSKPTTSSFWTDISYAIYLFKISFGKRAWPLLSKACDTAVVSDFATLADLCDLLTILSPVNTQLCPEIRKTLFRYLGSMAECRFGDQHFIAILVRHLSANDTNSDFCERAISYMQGLLVTRLGLFHPMSEKSQIASMRMLRRNHEYESARRAATIYWDTTRTQFGAGSLHARKAARELTHVLIDMYGYSKAVKLCYTVIYGREQVDSTGARVEPDIIEDQLSVYTMEDVAKIFDQQGEFKACVAWLEAAVRVARKIWPAHCISIQHILDKLEVLLEKGIAGASRI
jgi:hypothetical protein